MCSINHPNDMIFHEYMLQGIAKYIYNIIIDEVQGFGCFIPLRIFSESGYKSYARREQPFPYSLKSHFSDSDSYKVLEVNLECYLMPKASF